MQELLDDHSQGTQRTCECVCVYEIKKERKGGGGGGAIKPCLMTRHIFFEDRELGTDEINPFHCNTNPENIWL